MEDKVFIITGSSGIAAATIRRLVDAGSRVFFVGIDPDSCAELHRSIERTSGVAYLVTDLTDEGAADRVATACLEKWDRIDGLFNVAGISGRRFGDGPLHQSTDEGWRTTIQTNLDTQYRMNKAVVPHMMGNNRDDRGLRGVVLNMSSILAIYSHPRHFSALAYATSKGAIISMTRAMAAYYAAEGIRVNAIAPALTGTPMSSRATSDPDVVDFTKSKQVLLGGVLRAEDVADVAFFLLSPESRAITGQTIIPDAGWSVL